METIAAKIRRCALLRGSFKLRSGNVSDTYFDKYQFEADPQLLREIAEAMVSLLPPGTEVLAGLGWHGSTHGAASSLARLSDGMVSPPSRGNYACGTTCLLATPYRVGEGVSTRMSTAFRYPGSARTCFSVRDGGIERPLVLKLPT